MASIASPSLAHRTVSTIRTGGDVPAPSTPSGPSVAGIGISGSPFRTTPSAYSSPSALRAEEDTIVLEVGARKLVIGFAGDAIARGTMAFGPEQQRRVGDLRIWQDGYRRDWQGSCGGHGRAPGCESGTEDDAESVDYDSNWDGAHELWKLDVRHMDAGLIGDKLERALREALTKYLMIDSRPRRMIVVLPPGLPVPLLSTILDTLFGRFLTPSVALLSAPVSAAVAAGLRSALVIDIGWAETIVTSVYEYREISCTRTVRAGRMLVRRVHNLLGRRVTALQLSGEHLKKNRGRCVVSFEECEDVTARLVWCKPGQPQPTDLQRRQQSASTSQKHTGIGGGLATVDETDEADEDTTDRTGSNSEYATATDNNNSSTHDDNPVDSSRTIEIPLRSCTPPVTVRLAFGELTEPCEETFFGSGIRDTSRSNNSSGGHSNRSGGPATAKLASAQKMEHASDTTAEGHESLADSVPNGGSNSAFLPVSWDDEELPVPLLVYRHLLQLPVDVRGICMARILFVGGCVNVLGLRARLFRDIARLIAENGWDGVRGRGQAAAQHRIKMRRATVEQGQPETSSAVPTVWHDAANAQREPDPVEVDMAKARAQAAGVASGDPAGGGTSEANAPVSPGELHAVETLGAWSGASLLAQLRVPALAAVDRDQWTQQGGVAGAARPADVDVKFLQRQNIGGAGSASAGLAMRNVVGSTAANSSSGSVNWTLGPWGML